MRAYRGSYEDEKDAQRVDSIDSCSLQGAIDAGCDAIHWQRQSAAQPAVQGARAQEGVFAGLQCSTWVGSIPHEELSLSWVACHQP